MLNRVKEQRTCIHNCNQPEDISIMTRSILMTSALLKVEPVENNSNKIMMTVKDRGESVAPLSTRRSSMCHFGAYPDSAINRFMFPNTPNKLHVANLACLVFC